MTRRRDLNRKWSSHDHAYRKVRARFRAMCVKEDAKCHLCGDRIDYDRPDGRHPDAFEADHFYPVSTHPHLAYAIGNLRAAHKNCNASRGNAEVRQTLGVPSEEW